MYVFSSEMRKGNEQTSSMLIQEKLTFSFSLLLKSSRDRDRPLRNINLNVISAASIPMTSIYLCSRSHSSPVLFQVLSISWLISLGIYMCSSLFSVNKIKQKLATPLIIHLPLAYFCSCSLILSPFP